MKYFKTSYLDISPSFAKHQITSISNFLNEDVVITEKLDGENTNAGRRFFHARSPDSKSQLWQNKVKGIISNFQYKIPEDIQLCGENMYAVHSIFYENLESYFYLFNVLNLKKCKVESWDVVEHYASLFNIPTAPILFNGKLTSQDLNYIIDNLDLEKQEGFVIRVKRPFMFKNFNQNVAKWVRAGHIQTNQHWTKEWMKNPKINLLMKSVN